MDHSTGTTTAPSGANQWEELRRRARQIENDLEAKLFSFSKLLTTARNGSSRAKTFDEEPLLGTQDSFERLSFDIDSLLSSLQDVNGQMAQHCQQMPSSNAVVYTLQRHQEILKDNITEFHKIRANLEEQMNREQLFSGISKKNAGDFNYAGPRKNEFLHKENDSIRNSEIMIDDQIQIAMRTRETLRNQRSMMKSMQTQLTTLANKFPMIQNVMQRIGVKKRKDSIILAIVIAVCLFLLLLYIF